MSVAIMAACKKLQMPPTPKAVLMALADSANDHGFCWPSLTTISEWTCFGRTAVIEAIKWLEANGVLVADRADRYRTTYTVIPNGLKQSSKQTSTPAELVRETNNEVREPDDEVREADTNRKEPSRTVSVGGRKSEKPRGITAKKTDPIPYQAIVDGYNATLTGPDSPGKLARVRALTPSRANAIRKAWQAAPDKSTRFFDAIWAACAEDPFTSGVGPYHGKHENWRPDFDYLIRDYVVIRTFERAMARLENFR